MENAPQIFISYAQEDSRQVKKLYWRLEEAGFRPWMDAEDLLPGQDWRRAIEDALSESNLVILCLSSRSADSRGFIRKEMNEAVDLWQNLSSRDGFFIPVRLEECEVPKRVRVYPQVDLFEEDGWEKLLQTISMRFDQTRSSRLRGRMGPFFRDLVGAEADNTNLRFGGDQRNPETQILQIDLDVFRLEECRDIAAISRIHSTLTARELDSPESSYLRSFSRLSQDVDAALQQESAFNRRLALREVENNLETLLREIIRSGDRMVKRYHSIADRWRSIVVRKERELAETAEQRQEIDSPYIIGVPLTTQQEIFVGRSDISVQIEQLLLDRRRPPLLLYGQRRMGKTSLLHNLGRLLPSTIVPLYLDLQGPASQASDHAGFLYNFAKAMINWADRQRGLTWPVMTRESLANDPFTSFDEWLDEVEQALGANTALLMLDEFEALDGALAQGRFSESAVLGMLRHLIQHRPRFKVLLAGSHTLDEIHRWASYLINVQMIKLGYLKENEARQLIEYPTEDFALRYDSDASRRVLDVTRGHPFLVQLLCAEIVALKNEQEVSIRRHARLTDVEEAIPLALEHGSAFFADLERNQVDAGGLKFLRFLAAKGENASVKRHHLPSQPTVEKDRILTDLLRRDLIEEIDGGYRFQVEMIRRWFAQIN